MHIISLGCMDAVAVSSEEYAVWGLYIRKIVPDWWIGLAYGLPFHQQDLLSLELLAILRAWEP